MDLLVIFFAFIALVTIGSWAIVQFVFAICTLYLLIRLLVFRDDVDEVEARLNRL